jgi:hypothetical protein
MKTTRWASLLLLLGLGTMGYAQPAANSADALLDGLAQRGKTLADFTATVRLSETDNSTGLTTIYEGDIWFQNRDDAKNQDARARLTMEINPNSHLSPLRKKDFLLSGGWLWERDFQTTTQTRRQIVKRGDKVDLLTPSDGLFPLPIGLDQTRVRKEFSVKRVDAAKDDPPHTAHLELAPKPGTRAARKFASIGFWLDQESLMPVRIEATNANKSMQRTAELRDMRTDQGLAPDLFTLGPLRNWTLNPDQPYKD